MMQHKRSPVSLEQNNFMDLMPKRVKRTGVPLSSKEKKEKVSERISALQQLVSPYGKVHEKNTFLVHAYGYSFSPSGGNGIHKLPHEQVKVLSAPYLYSTPTQSQNDLNVLNAVFILKDNETSTLKAKGLCLVPISFTDGVASSNGADIWAPIKTSLSNSRQLVVDEASVITQG
ncbi:Transcription factor [Sesamum angolense]|uniref:Transcription factor n=1 Tax=Sesamum angolense TaxID=2727404 RepID=A0AAE1TAH2_9LAMI|nr:Transcription factor [Sesamum angolense]